MKLTAAIVAVSVAAVSSFAPAATFAHFLGGYNPEKNKAVPAAPSAAPSSGFSGFGHIAVESSAAPVAAPVVVAPPEIVFSGFGQSTGQMGGGRIPHEKVLLRPDC